jgi:hypothetical protein
VQVPREWRTVQPNPPDVLDRDLAICLMDHADHVDPHMVAVCAVGDQPTDREKAEPAAFRPADSLRREAMTCPGTVPSSHACRGYGGYSAPSRRWRRTSSADARPVTSS